MRYSLDKDWIGAAREAASYQSDTPLASIDDIAARLIQLHELMLDMPDPLARAFDRLPESDIGAQAHQRADDYYREEWSWELPAACDNPTAALVVGAEIRALDRHLADESRNRLGHPLESAITVGTSWTLVRRNLDWRPRTPTKLHPYRRRGLLHHRAIPQISDGYRVRLVELNDARKDPIQFGAALAPGVKHTVTTDQRGFIIDAIEFPDAERVTAEQLSSSADGPCWLHVWPELTIDPVVRNQIVEILKKWSFDKKPPPALIVAGSCHEKVAGKAVNRTTLLDSRGGQVAQHDKIIPYIAKDEEGNEEEEAISPGTEITVLISGGPAVAIGICRDFCDLNHEGSLYLGLDVDLVVVPSMGGLTTTQSHLVAAKGLRTETGTVAFVVQQADPKRAQVHYVVKPESLLDAAMATVSDPWTCHSWT